MQEKNRSEHANANDIISFFFFFVQTSVIINFFERLVPR